MYSFHHHVPCVLRYQNSANFNAAKQKGASEDTPFLKLTCTVQITVP
ncbi:hypothetical protein Z947_2313 [Sulfitobacter geojensis]|nr:hypothetical protein Z947_2313 [Sulfitobacter geojensis]